MKNGLFSHPWEMAQFFFVIRTCTFLCFNHDVYFQAPLVGFTLSDLLDKPWSQVSTLLPAVSASILSRMGFSIPTARRLSSNVANSRYRAFRYCNRFFFQEKVVSSTYVHSVRIEPTKLISV